MRVADHRSWDGNEGTNCYLPIRELSLSFVDALELAHPCAAVWWDRDVGDSLRGEIVQVSVLKVLEPFRWWDGTCEVFVVESNCGAPYAVGTGFYRLLSRDERWVCVQSRYHVTPEWFNLRRREEV